MHAVTTGQEGPEDGDFYFGVFHLCAGTRVLSREGRPVKVSSRAVDILLALVEHPGVVVDKVDIFSRAWPGITVEESNLRVHIRALRRILGTAEDGRPYILNVSGRGYSFVGRVSPGSLHVDRKESETRLAVPPIIGRRQAILEICSEFETARLVTLTGPGGIGKTRLAEMVAKRMAETRGYPLRIVRLAAMEQADEVVASVATALGISLRHEDPFEGIAQYLADKAMLVMIDNCEQVRSIVQPLVDRILAVAPHVHLVATSRERLLASGECVRRVTPLTFPAASEALDPTEILGHSAVKLIFERAGIDLATAIPTPPEIEAARAICEQLDGLPLAIELAAAHVNIFGMEGLKHALDDALILSARGHRTAESRHQSLRHALDWSYHLLPQREREIFARLSVFRGLFSAEYAQAVVADDAGGDIGGVLRALADKSLLGVVRSDDREMYQMLRITRAYAGEKLRGSGDGSAVHRRHAEFYRCLFERAERTWTELSRGQWVERYRHAMDDVRGALDWCFREAAQPAIGATLLAATLPFGYQLSAIDEFKRRSEVALKALAESVGSDRAKLRLMLALRTIALNAVSDPALDDHLLERALVLAAEIETAALQVEPLLLLTICRIEQGQYGAAVEATRRLEQVADAADDPLAALLAQRAAAQAAHFSSDHQRARLLARKVLDHPARAIPLIYSQASVDRRISMNIIVSRIDWIEGYCDRAATVIAETLEAAAQDGPFAICQALALAGCPIALWRGDLDLAAERIGLLEKYAARYGLDRWHRLAEGYAGVLARRFGTEGAVASRWLPVGRLSQELLVSADETLIVYANAKCDGARPAGWCAPEIMRAKALGIVDGEAAEAALREAVRCASAQGALSWQLRCVTSLARLLNDRGSSAEAETLLREMIAKMPEGRGTSDFETAIAVLAHLERAPALVRVGHILVS